MFNSLTLSPALCALLLKPRQAGRYEALPRLALVLIFGWLGYILGASPRTLDLLRGWLPSATGAAYFPVALPWASAAVLAVVGWFLAPLINFGLGWTFRMFNLGFKYSTDLYTRTVGLLLRLSVVVLLLYGGLLFLTWLGFTQTPTGFIPSQDKGYLLVNVQLPDAASVARTQRAMKTVEEMALKQPGVAHTVGISGTSILLNANAPNFGAMYLMLDEFGKRTGPGLSADEIAASLQGRLQDELEKTAPGATVNIFQAPPIDGLGTAGGFKIIVEDRGNEGLIPLEKATDDAIDRGAAVLRGDKQPALEGLFTSFRRRRRGWS